MSTEPISSGSFELLKQEYADIKIQPQFDPFSADILLVHYLDVFFDKTKLSKFINEYSTIYEPERTINSDELLLKNNIRSIPRPDNPEYENRKIQILNYIFPLLLNNMSSKINGLDYNLFLKILIDENFEYIHKHFSKVDIGTFIETYLSHFTIKYLLYEPKYNFKSIFDDKQTLIILPVPVNSNITTLEAFFGQPNLMRNINNVDINYEKYATTNINTTYTLLLNDDETVNNRIINEDPGKKHFIMNDEKESGSGKKIIQPINIRKNITRELWEKDNKIKQQPNNIFFMKCIVKHQITNINSYVSLLNQELDRLNQYVKQQFIESITSRSSNKKPFTKITYFTNINGNISLDLYNPTTANMPISYTDKLNSLLKKTLINRPEGNLSQGIQNRIYNKEIISSSIFNNEYYIINNIYSLENTIRNKLNVKDGVTDEYKRDIINIKNNVIEHTRLSIFILQSLYNQVYRKIKEKHIDIDYHSINIFTKPNFINENNYKIDKIAINKRIGYVVELAQTNNNIEVRGYFSEKSRNSNIYIFNIQDINSISNTLANKLFNILVNIDYRDKKSKNYIYTIKKFIETIISKEYGPGIELPNELYKKIMNNKEFMKGIMYEYITNKSKEHNDLFAELYNWIINELPIKVGISSVMIKKIIKIVIHKKDIKAILNTTNSVTSATLCVDDNNNFECIFVGILRLFQRDTYFSYFKNGDILGPNLPINKKDLFYFPNFIITEQSLISYIDNAGENYILPVSKNDNYETRTSKILVDILTSREKLQSYYQYCITNFPNQIINYNNMSEINKILHTNNNIKGIMNIIFRRNTQHYIINYGTPLKQQPSIMSTTINHNNGYKEENKNTNVNENKNGNKNNSKKNNNKAKNNNKTRKNYNSVKTVSSAGYATYSINNIKMIVNPTVDVMDNFVSKEEDFDSGSKKSKHIKYVTMKEQVKNLHNKNNNKNIVVMYVNLNKRTEIFDKEKVKCVDRKKRINTTFKKMRNNALFKSTLNLTRVKQNLQGVDKKYRFKNKPKI